jgi:hypothetical protein
MCTFADSLNVDLKSLMEKTFTVEGCYELLKQCLPRQHPELIISKDDLKVGHNPFILPPHVRTGQGRPKKKRIRKGQRVKQFCDRNEQFRQREEVNHEEADIHHTTQHVCQICGLDGHNSRTCSSSTDGQGHHMTQNIQDEHIKRGYLIIPIDMPGCTNLPSTIQDYHNMRKRSEFPTMTFTHEINNRPICLSFEDDD